MMQRLPQRNRSNYRRGFTLLEMTVAVGVLGVGLIMVAAFFPAALLEHQRTLDDARALDLTTTAVAMLHNRINPELLYVNNNDLANGFDSPWYAMPFRNMDVRPEVNGSVALNDQWDPYIGLNICESGVVDCTDPRNTENYYSALNNIPPFLGFDTDNNPSTIEFTTASNPVQIFGLDQLTDRILPRNAARVREDADRLAWYGFYRTLASGKRDFTVAVCKQRKDRQYAVQDLSDSPVNNYGVPRVRLGNPTVNKLFPVPWRVTVGRLPNSQILANSGVSQALGTGGVDISQLAPRGSKIMIHGRARRVNGVLNEVLDFPLGRILTVTESTFGIGIRVLEDVSDIPAFDPTNERFAFDIWVFPPPYLGELPSPIDANLLISTFENESPVLRWKVGL